MNTVIVHKTDVKGSVLDNLAKALPGIIADALELPDGKLAIVNPKQVSLEFFQASPRDVGSDIKIMIFARSFSLRTAKKNDLAKEILEKIVLLLNKPGEEHSIDIRLYFMDIGLAEHSPGN